jgi:NAD(P)-dependent dehydrogenase (short-subunit alcohol dehydrogenase family)
MKTIVVTGGSGKAGRATVKVLQEAGYTVRNLDRAGAAASGCRTWGADLTDYGQTIDGLAGADAVVHLAAIPNDGLYPPERTFRENTLSTFNVFHAAALRSSARSSCRGFAIRVYRFLRRLTALGSIRPGRLATSHPAICLRTRSPYAVICSGSSRPHESCIHAARMYWQVAVKLIWRGFLPVS